jgi:hypothetical protein
MNTTKNKKITKTYKILVVGQYRVTDVIEAKSSKEAQAIAEKNYLNGNYENFKDKEILSPRIYERFITKTVEYI